MTLNYDFWWFWTARILQLHPELQLPICRGDHNSTFYSNMQFRHLVCRRWKLRLTRLRWKGLRYLASQEQYVTDLVSDQHPSIEEFPNIQHWFDSWHVIKGMLLLFLIEFCSAAWVLDAYDILAVFTQIHISFYQLGVGALIPNISRNKYLYENLFHKLY